MKRCRFTEKKIARQHQECDEEFDLSGPAQKRITEEAVFIYLICYVVDDMVFWCETADQINWIISGI